MGNTICGPESFSLSMKRRDTFLLLLAAVTPVVPRAAAPPVPQVQLHTPRPEDNFTKPTPLEIQERP